ncbi:MAG: YraN family protein [Patescibacteria group bacterium]
MLRKNLGAQGEQLVAQVLEQRGHRILLRNWRTRWMEIDLVTQINQEVWVVEVKTRTSEVFGRPEEAVTPGKLIKLRKAGEIVASQPSFSCFRLRLVVVAVQLEPKPKIKFINVGAS